MREISKRFPGVKALDRVSFDVQSGEIHALVGENGAGKSTLMNVLGGVYPHGSYDGEIVIDGEVRRFDGVHEAEDAGIAVVHQELSLVPEFSIAENIFLGREPRRFGVIQTEALYSRAQKVLDELQLTLEPHIAVGTLGIGQQHLIEIAKALSRNARILVLDEPTAALTDTEGEVLFRILRRLRGSGAGIIYISHKLGEVLELSDRITVLRDGRTVSTDATSALDTQRLIAGLVGAGRSDLMMAIFGAHPGRKHGEFFLGGTRIAIGSPGAAIAAGIGFVTEDRKRFGLFLDQTIVANLTLAALKRISGPVVTDVDAETAAGQKSMQELHIKARSVFTIAGTLSGGNQQKIVLAKWLLTNPKVLFLDEPTRGIDVGAKQEIYQQIDRLASEGLAIVLVSSELPEVLGLSDRILVLHEGRLTGEFRREEATAEGIMACATGQAA